MVVVAAVVEDAIDAASGKVAILFVEIMLVVVVDAAAAVVKFLTVPPVVSIANFGIELLAVSIAFVVTG